MATLMNLKKTGTKKSTTKRTVAKPAAKRTTTAKKTATKKAATRKPAAKKAEPKRRGIAHLDPKVLKRYQSELTEVGERLAAAQEEHDDASEAVHEIAAEARSNDIPMNIVTELLGVSRQYLYKGLVGHGPNGRKNGGSKKSTTTKKATSAAKKTIKGSQAKAGRARQANKKPAGKKLTLKR